MKTHIKLILLGAGPGNIQVSLKLQELGIKESDYLVLEKGLSAGTFFKSYPVHNQLISNNKVVDGDEGKEEKSERFDWNSLITQDKSIRFSNYTRDFYPHKKHMVKMLNDLAIKKKLPIKYQTTCSEVFHDGYFFYVVTNRGTFTCEYLVCGTGLIPKNAPIPGA